MSTPIVNIPNRVLDLATLKLVRASVVKEKRLITKTWSAWRPRRFLPDAIEYCAVGSVFKPQPGQKLHRDEFEEFVNKHDVDPLTLAEIICVNDTELANVSPAERRDAVLDWLDRAIAYAENIAAVTAAVDAAERTGARVHVSFGDNGATILHDADACDETCGLQVAA